MHKEIKIYRNYIKPIPKNPDANCNDICFYKKFFDSLIPPSGGDSKGCGFLYLS